MQDFTLTNDEKTGGVDIARLDNDRGVKYRRPARSS